MKEITFAVSEAEEGGYYGRAIGESIFTQVETLDELRLMIRDAIDCHHNELIEPPQVSISFSESTESPLLPNF